MLMAELKEVQGAADTLPDKRDFALWNLGFRPFYLVASTYAALSILIWAAQFSGWLPHTFITGPVWHAHEMLFGFVLPVIVGFLLTAGQNWTGRKTLSGYPLMALVLLWLSARVLVMSPWGWASAVANAAFPWVAAAVLAVPFIRAGVRRNYFFLALLFLLGAVSLGIHATHLTSLQALDWLNMQMALDIVLFIMVVMAGRVTPPFTANGVPGSQPKRIAWLERVAPGLVLAVLVADITSLHGTLMAFVLLLATLAHALRLSLWQSWKTVGTPLVWVLHLAYGWIVLHLSLRTLAEIGWISSSTAIHALTAGAMGTLIIGMMTRTARGHTGLALKADRYDVTCYLLVQAGAVVRVFAPLLVPALLLPSILVSALLWSAAFALYAVRYWPLLTRARVDGRPG